MKMTKNWLKICTYSFLLLLLFKIRYLYRKARNDIQFLLQENTYQFNAFTIKNDFGILSESDEFRFENSFISLKITNEHPYNLHLSGVTNYFMASNTVYPYKMYQFIFIKFDD